MLLNGVNPFPKEFVKQCYEKHWWSGMTLGEMLDRTCDVYPFKEALVTGEIRLTYQQLCEWTDRAAIAFLELGIEKLDRVLLQIPNVAEYIYAYYGLFKMGAIPVLCLPRFSEREMEYFCKVTGAKAWIAPLRYEKIDYLPMIEFVRSRQPHLKHILFVDPPDKSTEPLPDGALSFNELLNKVDLKRYPRDYLRSIRPDPDEVCHLIPTGGSTGRPKIVPRTHNNWICNAEYRAKADERSPHDISLIATPLTHNMAIDVSLNPTFLTGGKVVLISSTRPKEILEAIQKERVNRTILAVAQIQQIMEYPELDQYDLSSLQFLATGGSPIPSDLIKKVYETLGCKFCNSFGMSEGACSQTRFEDPAEAILHTIGWPICPYDEFKVIDANGNELPQGMEGELIARGPCVFQGYFKGEAENQEAFTPDGFFRTGDIAKIDPEGRVSITGRKKDIIIRGGENISAFEVEELITGHPKVERVSAVGMPDPVLGERVCVFIKPKKEMMISLEEIVSYLKEMPMTKVGKVDKRRLKEEIKEKLKKEGKI
jgi:2,3-dihydroxybenzoate-AMP ligase